MSGRLILIQRYDRPAIRAHPDVLVAFGDNLLGPGFGGQAAAARDEPNAVGIPTKRRPTRDDSAYFSDADFGEARTVMEPLFERLLAHLGGGGVVWWPAAGLGTGLAELPQRAPAIAAYIDDWLARLEAISE